MSRKPPDKEKFRAPLKGTPKITRLPSSRMLYLVMALMIVAFLVGGYVFYHLREQQMRQRIEGGLSIVAQLKVDEIAHWRAERLVGANLLAGSPFFIEGVAKFMASPADTEIRDEVLANLAAVEESYPYQNILLVDVNGSLLLSLNESVLRLSDMTLAQLAVAIKEHKAVMTDFHYPPGSNSPHLDVIAPLFPWGQDSQQSIGAVVFCINPAQYLYPLVQSWPIPSETAEILLVERDGDQVLFLNDLRYQKDAALKLRIPLSRQENPAVMAVLGKEGVVEGKDYRGVEVLAVLKHIPDSPWYVVAKIDASEALSAWRFQTGIIVASVAGLLAAALAVTGLIWQGRQRLAYQALYQAEVESQALRRHFEYLVKYANDIIILADEDHHIVEANDRALESYGYRREEMLGLPLAALIPPGGFSSYQERLRKIQQKGTIVVEAIHQRKDGSMFPVEVSGRNIEIEGKPYLQEIIRDITERKKAEETLRRSEDRYRTVLEQMEEAYFEVDIAGNFTFVNDAMCCQMGYSREELIGRNYRLYTPEADGPRVYKAYNQIYKTGKPFKGFSSERVRKDGTRIFTETAAFPLRNESGEIIGFRGIIRDVTERKQAEEALRLSEHNFRDSIENSPLGIRIANKDGKTIYANRALLDMWGYSSIEELEAVPRKQRYTPESYAEHRTRLGQRKRGEHIPSNYEISIVRSDGQVRHLSASRGELLWGGEKVFQLVYQDITERKWVDEALRKEKEFSESLITSMQDGLSVLDSHGVHVDVNPAFCHMTGFSKEELVGVGPPHPYWPPEAYEEIESAFQKTLRGEFGNFELTFVRKNGERFPVIVSPSLVNDEGGNLVNYFATVKDITDRKKAEETLRESETKHRTLFETMAQGVVYQDAKGQIISANPAAERILGLTLDQMMGRTSIDPRWKAIHEDGSDFPGDTHPAMVVLKTGKPVRNVVMGVFHPGFNKHVWININAIPQFVAGESKPYQVYTTFEDITELKRAVEELEKAVEELQRSNAELEQFAYVASHDLQEPLRMVSSYTQLLERRYKDKLDADANDFINYAVGGAERMQELLNDLLVYSRVGTRAKPFKRTDMEAVLEAALANLQVTIKESKARVSHDPLPAVMADEVQLVQVFQNLIGNAIKFRGEKPPRIHVSAKQVDSEWVFAVKDNGIGIEPQYFDRVFLIFQRLYRDEYPGTGTGLAIAKRIVERHGGRMWVESQPGKGSTFYFSIKATGERQEAGGNRREATGVRQQA